MGINMINIINISLVLNIFGTEAFKTGEACQDAHLLNLYP